MKKDKKKRVLFIDRDGTLIKEAPPFYKVDSFDKLEFYPHVFEYMLKISKLEYDLVMVTNQDGLGTTSFPEEDFWPVQKFVIRSFENEGVFFSEVLIDKTYPSEKINTRKPGTGMLLSYLNNEKYDIKKSFVIGDRITDMQFAMNLGCKGLWLKNDSMLGADEIEDPKALKKVIALETKNWKSIYKFLKRA